ncbi:hypothetical protein ACHAXA_005397 [Cyclostephanos tholiformis]|uniref:Fungal lipase-type domain-containing protein n=1 Tax=Cyclostephanos tholiformis TaxID=382380 RepID=A0ABD3RI04_9STRA
MSDANMSGGGFIRPSLRRSGGQRFTVIDNDEEPRPLSTAAISAPCIPNSESSGSARYVGGISRYISNDKDDESLNSVTFLFDDNSRRGVVVDGAENKDGRAATMDEGQSSSVPPSPPARKITPSNEELSEQQLFESGLTTVSPKKMTRPMTAGELCMARKGILSRASMMDSVIMKQLLPSSNADDTLTSPSTIVHDDLNKKISPQLSVMIEAKEDEQDGSPVEFKQQSEDILTVGQYYLGISMLVYMYSHLRETCRMGHTRVKMEDIDVNSHHSHDFNGTKKSFLGLTKSAGSIVRTVVAELAHMDDDDDEYSTSSLSSPARQQSGPERISASTAQALSRSARRVTAEERDYYRVPRRYTIGAQEMSLPRMLTGRDTFDEIGVENKEYEKSMTAQLRTWIDDSRVSHLDEGTKNMIAEMKKDAARRRWRRLLLSIRLSYKLNEGKRPDFENLVVVPPGCDGTKKRSLTIPKYFQEGTVMNTLIESGIEMVWFSDMTQCDVVYGICVQRQQRKVTVVFRGTVNAHNWGMNLKIKTNKFRNPVMQFYPRRTDEIDLHSGFALYLLRKRKDTGLSKLHEIFVKVEEIGRELAPDGKYKLSITGHSLGGALATLCGFYFAARSRFAHLPTIYVWTFAAPRVGTQAFMDAWQHLERSGRIRHARFSVARDVVPLIPQISLKKNDLQFYKHVGMRVHLHGIGMIGRWRLRRNLDVTYPLHHDWMSKTKRAFMNSILVNLNTFSGFNNNHTLTEHQKRLHFAISYRNAIGSGGRFLATLKYERDEPFLISANAANYDSQIAQYSFLTGRDIG